MHTYPKRVYQLKEKKKHTKCSYSTWTCGWGGRGAWDYEKFVRRCTHWREVRCLFLTGLTRDCPLQVSDEEFCEIANVEVDNTVDPKFTVISLKVSKIRTTYCGVTCVLQITLQVCDLSATFPNPLKLRTYIRGLRKSQFGR